MSARIQFKGVKDGLIAFLPEGPEEWALEELAAHMHENRHFFDGMEGTLYIAGLQRAELLDGFRQTLGEGFHMGEIRPGGQATIDPVTRGVEYGIPFTETVVKTCEGTVRNGQRIAFYGDIVLLGDVNPGGQVMAGGSIYVWGALRGIAHAGAMGDETAFVMAMEMCPQQIRIARALARPPAEETPQGLPEVALLNGDQIEMRPYTQARHRR